jgi:hypothetical protein
VVKIDIAIIESDWPMIEARKTFMTVGSVMVNLNGGKEQVDQFFGDFY